MKKFLLTVLILLIIPVFGAEKIEMTQPDTGVYVFKINTKKYGDKIKPYMSSNLMTPQKLYEDKNFDLVVNAGFFDVKNGKTVSYVTLDGKMTGDVEEYRELTKKLKQEKRLNNVLNRAELRILEKNNKLKFDIAYHNDPIQKGYTLKHAIQGGPEILPKMDLAKEGFVTYNKQGDILSQSVDILKKRERTVVGLKGKYFYIVLFSTDYKADATDMEYYLKDKLKLKKAMAFDGGLSTALSTKGFKIGSLGKYQRKVKSFIIIER